MSTLAKLLMGVGGEEPVPDNPGTLYGGGYYAGKIRVSGQAYAIVLAPRAQGGETDYFSLPQWKTTQTTTVGTESRNDGWGNTQAMIQAGSALHPAAAFCRGLNINGYDDWYLPAIDELEIIYRNLKPTTSNNSTLYGENPSAIPPTGNYTASNPSQTNVDIFKSGGGEDLYVLAYWSSTEGSYSTGWALYPDLGQQGRPLKTSMNFVRAVRRVAIGG